MKFSLYKVKNNQELKRIINTKYPGANKETEMENSIFKTLPLNLLDTSSVTDMDSCFKNIYTFNEDISKWDVSNVENMDQMFSCCFEFNQPLDNWDVSNVCTMELIFHSCHEFNQPLNSWDVSNVEDFGYAFYEAKSFNQPLNNWDVSNTLYIDQMFSFCENFNQEINWELKNTVETNHMFHHCKSLDFKKIKNLFKGENFNQVQPKFDYHFIKERDRSQLLALIEIYGEIDKFEEKLFNKMSREELLAVVERRYCSLK